MKAELILIELEKVNKDLTEKLEKMSEVVVKQLFALEERIKKLEEAQPIQAGENPTEEEKPEREPTPGVIHQV